MSSKRACGNNVWVSWSDLLNMFPIDLKLQILEYHTWYHRCDRQYDFWVKKNESAFEITLIEEDDVCVITPDLYYGMLYGRFVEDRAKRIFLLIKWGLSYKCVNDFNWSCVIPRGARGVKITTETNHRDGRPNFDLCLLNFTCRTLEKCVFEAIPLNKVCEIVQHHSKFISRGRLKTLIFDSTNGDDFLITRKQARILATVTNLGLRGCVEFENGATTDLLGTDSRIEKLRFTDEVELFPGNENIIENISVNTSLKSLEFIVKPEAIMIGTQDLGVVARAKRDEYQLDIRFFECLNNLVDLKIAEITPAELVVLVKVLRLNSLSFSTSPRNERDDRFMIFGNRSITKFEYYVQGDGHFLMKFIPCLRQLQECAIVAKLDGGMCRSRVLPYFKSNAKVNEFVKLNEYFDLCQCFRGMERQIIHLKIILPRNKIPKRFVNSFTNLITLKISCLNFSKVLEQTLSNNKHLRYLETQNLIKGKHLSLLSECKIRYISYCNAVNTSGTVLQFIRSMTATKTYNGVHLHKYEERYDVNGFREKGTKIANGLARQECSDDITTINVNSMWRKVAEKWNLVPPFVKHSERYWVEYWEQRVDDEGVWGRIRYDYIDSSGGVNKVEDDLYHMDEVKRNEEIQKRIKNSCLEFMKCNFAVIKGKPTGEELRLFDRILKGVYFFAYNQFKSKTTRARVYSITGNGVYYDLMIDQHDRTIYSLHEHHHYFIVDSSRKNNRVFDGWDGPPVMWKSWNNFDDVMKRKVYDIDYLSAKAKVELFGDRVLTHVSNFNMMTFLYLCAFGIKIPMPEWVTETYNGMFIDSGTGGFSSEDDVEYSSDKEGVTLRRTDVDAPLMSSMVDLQRMETQVQMEEDEFGPIAWDIYGDVGLMKMIFDIDAPWIFQNRVERHTKPQLALSLGSGGECNIM